MIKLTVIESVIWNDVEKLTTSELEDLIGTHFSFNENASEDFIKHFYTRQQVALSIIEKRLGRNAGRDPSYVWRDKSKDPSIWSTPRSATDNPE